MKMDVVSSKTDSILWEYILNKSKLRTIGSAVSLVSRNKLATQNVRRYEIYFLLFLETKIDLRFKYGSPILWNR
jgi:hypothetical protein